MPLFSQLTGSFGTRIDPIFDFDIMRRKRVRILYLKDMKIFLKVEMFEDELDSKFDMIQIRDNGLRIA